MGIISPGVRIDGPECAPARYGLLSVAEVEDVSDGHWQGGYYHELESCDDLPVQTVACASPDEEKPSEGSGLSFPEGDAFIAIAPFRCSTGGLPLSEAWAHAQARLDQGEARTLERTFWTGVDRLGNPIRETLGVDPSLAEDITPGADPVNITDGMAMLESWAGENQPCAPIIHAQRGIATYLAERGLVERDGDVLRAIGTGSRVAVGGGYTLSGPAGDLPEDGGGWMFITGSVKIRRGPVFFTPDQDDVAAATDRIVNDITVFAERSYGFSLGCGIAAVRVHLQSRC